MSHTKLIEVSQERVWQYTNGRWAYVWEDGYDALACVEFHHGSGLWHWWTTYTAKSGFTSTKEEAMKATGYKENP